MFEVGDLVRFRGKGVITRSREHPDKVIGIVIAIARDVFWTYEGDKDDSVTVRWMPLGTQESMPEFLLEEVVENA